jgi:putative nucleotidyltransferase with HDIG domain
MGAMDKEAATAKLLGFIQQMPSLSTTATKVLQICNTPAPAPNDLNRVISLDPVLAGKVLKLINSAYYARRNKITSLTRAIIMLGINTIKNLVLSTAIVNCVSHSALSRTMDMNLFWSHSIQVGVTARLIAKEMGIPALDQEFFFLAGLMHDLGKIPMSNQFPELYNQALTICHNSQIDICLAEKQLMGLTHCDIGQMIVKKWDLGNGIESAFTSHHNIRVGVPGDDRVGWIIELADMYAHLPRHAETGESENMPFSIPQEMVLLNEKTGVSHEKLVMFDDTIFVEMENARSFLNL